MTSDFPIAEATDDRHVPRMPGTSGRKGAIASALSHKKTALVSADLGVVDAIPAHENAPRKLADIPLPFRRPLKPPGR